MLCGAAKIKEKNKIKKEDKKKKKGDSDAEDLSGAWNSVFSNKFPGRADGMAHGPHLVIRY